MTARVLVVDDILSNVKLLEAKLTAEYFEVVSAFNGLECLKKMEEATPDIVLLDVMMPGMDGFEVCRRIKGNPKTAHVPVVMVTALDQPSDRVAGLEAGADDFLTKPVDDAALFARVRSLVRLKMMTDELRMRETTGQSMGLIDPATTLMDANPTGRMLIIEDRPESVAGFAQALQPGGHEVASVDTFEEALVRVYVFLSRPVDLIDLTARVRTQLRKKRYQVRLRHIVQLSLEMAITDQLTGLHNRRYMARHLDNLVSQAGRTGKPLSFLIMDIDYFKAVNDTHG